jgi:hypothetical protein
LVQPLTNLKRALCSFYYVLILCSNKFIKKEKKIVLKKGERHG